MDKKTPSHELDRLFDAAVERTAKGMKPADVYGFGPMASDHLLVKKSWAYFRGRVQAIEDQYQQLLKAKEDEIGALNKKAHLLQTENDQLQENLKDQEQLEADFGRARFQDFYDLKRKNETVFQSWQEERVNLEQKISRLELDKKDIAKKFGAFRKEVLIRDQAWQKKFDDLRTQQSQNAVEKFQKDKDFTRHVQELEESIVGRDRKIDLLRTEIEHRDELLRKQAEVANLLTKKNEEGESESLNLKSALQEAQKEIENLRIKVDILNKEKDTMRKSWQREQSEWRELWDRQRELWDRQREGEKKEGDEPFT